MEIPKKMRALMLIKHVPDFSVSAEEIQQHFEIREVDVPKPKSGEVLIKVARSPINPSDLSSLKGSYDSSARSNLPWIPGFEGSGTVVANGGGMMGWSLQGKRVGVLVGAHGGMWAQYVAVPAMNCLTLSNDVDFDTGSSCFVNPMTVLAFVELAKAGGHSAIVHTAAASSLGKMLIRICVSERIKLIAIVRRKEQVDELLQLGATAAFATVDDTAEEEEEEGEEGKEKVEEGGKKQGWEAALKAKCKELRCTLAFDAVGGELTGKVLHAMPKGSTMKVYGGLAEQPCQAYVGDLIFQQKKVEGFWLSEYVKTKGLLGKLMWARRVQYMVAKELKTTVRAVVETERMGEGLSMYVKDMSAGKVLLDPQKREGEGEEGASKKEKKKSTEEEEGGKGKEKVEEGTSKKGTGKQG